MWFDWWIAQLALSLLSDVTDYIAQWTLTKTNI